MGKKQRDAQWPAKFSKDELKEIAHREKSTHYQKDAMDDAWKIDIIPFVDALYDEIGPLFMELAQPLEAQETLDAIKMQEQKDKETRKQIKGLLAGAFLYFANGGTL